MLFALLLPAAPAIASDTSSTVTASMLNARLKEVEAAASLDEETRGSLVEMLHNALGSLEKIRANKATMEAYIQAVKTAPQQASELRAQLDKDTRASRDVKVTATEASPFDEIERELLQEKANHAAVESRLADLESQLDSARARPALIQQQLLAAEQDKEQLESQLKLPAPADELLWLTEARRWLQTARVAALRSESAMLDQELLSMPMRIELLEAQRDKDAQTVERIAVRVAMLEKLSTRQGRVEAEQAEADAEAAVDEAVGKHPLIQELAEENAALTREISAMAAKLKDVSASDEAINREAKQIEDNFRAAREKLEIAGLSEVLGEVLREQRNTLPDQRKLRRKIRELEKENAQSTLRQIKHALEYKRLRNPGIYIEERTVGLDADEAALLSVDLKTLASARRELLDAALGLDKSYSRSLTELEMGNRRLLKTAADFDIFLAEKLLWIRSAPNPNLATLVAIPGQVADLLSPGRWYGVFSMLVARITHSPLFVFLLGLVGALFWKARQFRVLLRETGSHVGKPSRDKFSFTLRALGFTLLLAASWPMLLGTLGWELALVQEATPFSRAVSVALLKIAPVFFYLQFFSVLCLPGGMAARHFGWPDPVAQQLRRGFRRLMLVFLPAIFLLVLLVTDEQKMLLAGLERLLIVTALVAVAVFFYRLSKLLVQQGIASMVRLRYLWLALTVVTPLLLAVLALTGYFYTAGKLGSSLIQTLWFVFGLVVLHQVVVRWLLLTQRRLALQAARERQLAARKEKAPVDSEMDDMPALLDEPRIDLVSMREESRKLLNMLLVIIGIIGFWLIWSDVLPALHVLDEVTLWHRMVTVAGEETVVPVTLANIGIAILIVIATYVAMKRLPALLEIVLLHRVSMTTGARYTVTTLTIYTIVGIGLLAFFNVIGADWSKLQWMFAALSVGIGFGLQEIVANFISGLIILFERPIRIGDVVTIGDTDGMVTRIQIRATTIRTWDRQELLVPNKEFITGRLLNWSLSDQTTRIKVPVGVAYGSDVQLAMALMDEGCYVGAQDIRMTTITQLHEAINTKFNDAGICIAFPQRDVHLDVSRPLEVRIQRDAGTGDAAT
jgi:potassium efflux system protein